MEKKSSFQMNRNLITRNVPRLDSDHTLVCLKVSAVTFPSHAHLPTRFGPDEPGDGTEVVVVGADEDPEHRGLSAAPLHVLGGLCVGLHLYWRLTPRIRFYKTKVNRHCSRSGKWREGGREAWNGSQRTVLGCRAWVCFRKQKVNHM